jgi:UDP-glucuronate 4-epimerase
MSHILVTGGAGFIASHLIDLLLSDGRNQITVIDNFNDFYNPSIKRANVTAHMSYGNYRLVEADIADAPKVFEIFADGKFDIVVHLAARAGVRPSLVDPMEYERSNIKGTYTLLEAAKRYEVQQFVFGSSSSVYGINAKVPFSEEDAISKPISPYAATKIAGEAACHVYSHLYGMRIICLRFFTVYGARQRPDLAIHKFARLISNNQPVPIFGDGTSQRDYTYIEDILSGIMGAMSYQASNFEIFNLGESQTIELKRLIELLEEALGKKAILDYQPAQPGDVPITFANIEKAQRLLGYNPQTRIEDGIREFAKWFRATYTA